jgi:hypothetical protein
VLDAVCAGLLVGVAVAFAGYAGVTVRRIYRS